MSGPLAYRTNLKTLCTAPGCPGSLMSLRGPTSHVTPFDLCIYSSVTYTFPVSWLVEIKLFQNCFKLFQLFQKRSVRTLFATAQQPHSRDIFIIQKNLPLDKVTNQHEGILAYKVINDTFLLNDFLNHGDVGHQIQLRNIGDLRITFYAATQSQLFVRYRAIKTWNGLSGDLRSSSSLCTLKNKLRQLYLSLT